MKLVDKGKQFIPTLLRMFMVQLGIMFVGSSFSVGREGESRGGNMANLIGRSGSQVSTLFVA